MSKLLENSIKMSDNILSKFDHWRSECILNFQGVDYILFGKYIRHNTKFNEIGQKVSAIKATICFHSRELHRVGVPFINSDGIIQLANGSGSTITISDELASRRYRISNIMPDETLGIIVCDLQLLNNNFIPSHP